MSVFLIGEFLPYSLCAHSDHFLTSKCVHCLSTTANRYSRTWSSPLLGSPSFHVCSASSDFWLLNLRDKVSFLLSQAQCVTCCSTPPISVSLHCFSNTTNLLHYLMTQWFDLTVQHGALNGLHLNSIICTLHVFLFQTPFLFLFPTAINSFCPNLNIFMHLISQLREVLCDSEDQVLLCVSEAAG